MVLDVNSHIDRTLYFHEETEMDLALFLQKYLKDDCLFFDIGANSGYFSLIASNIVTKGSIHAFEPMPPIYHNFRRAIRLNNIRNIILNEACVGDKNMYVPFYAASHADVSGIRATSYHKHSTKIRRKMITIDSYCKDLKLNVDILKIDVEGAEKYVLLGAQGIVKRDKPIIILEFSNITTSSFGYHPNVLYDFLSSHGYKIFSYKNGRLRSQKKKEYYSEDLYCFAS